MDYAKEYVDQFNSLVELMANGGERLDLALKFAGVGWLTQVSVTPARFEITAAGRLRLDH